MMNKKLSLGLLLVVALLAGCTDKAAPPATSASETVTGQEATGTEEQGTTTTDPLAAPTPVKVVVQGASSSDSSSASQLPDDIGNVPEKQQITKLLQSGAVKLDNPASFEPNQPITRSEFIRWMYGYDGKHIKPKLASQPSFSDVDSSNPDYALIEGLQAAGVITGFPDGTMQLDKELTRQELTLLWGWYERERSVTNPIVDSSVTQFALKKYKDGAQISDTYVAAVGFYANQEKHPLEQVFGVTNKLEPQQPVTHAQAARWIVENTVVAEQQQEQNEVTKELQTEATEAMAAQQATQTVTVNDIATSPVQWQITRLISSGIPVLDGQGHFQPDTSITRRDFIRWMYQYDPKELTPADQPPPAFTDVQNTDPDYALVDKLRQADLLPAVNNNELKLDQPLTREQLTVLWAWYQQMNNVREPILALSTVQDSLFTISDAKEIGTSYSNKEPYIRAVATFVYGEPTYRNVFGFTTLLKPQAEVSRAEAAQWLVEYTES